MSSERIESFEALLEDLRGVDTGNAKGQFTALFARGCVLLEIDDTESARAFGTSRSNTSRWRRGKVVPPAAGLVLKRLRELVDERISKIKRLSAGGGYGSAMGSFPLAAKGR